MDFGEIAEYKIWRIHRVWTQSNDMENVILVRNVAEILPGTTLYIDLTFKYSKSGDIFSAVGKIDIDEHLQIKRTFEEIEEITGENLTIKNINVEDLKRAKGDLQQLIDDKVISELSDRLRIYWFPIME